MNAITGGDKLAAKLRQISERVNGKATLRVGFLEGSTYPDGTSVPMVAAIQEFGAPKAGIPPRPYFRNLIAAKSGTWGDAVGNLLPANGYDATKTLGQAGEGIKGQLQKSIKDTMEPALSPVTLMLRKMRSEDQSLVVTGKVVGEAAQKVADGEDYGGVSTKPLVDSGHLMNSADYEVTS